MSDDLDPEYATVGGLLLAPNLLEPLRGWLRPDDFARGACTEIYTLLLDMHAGSRPIDAVLVLAELRARGQIDRGGFLPREMITMIETVPAPAMTPHYAQLVVEQAIFRRIAAAGGRLTQVGKNRRGTPTDAYRSLDAILGELRADRARWSQLTGPATADGAPHPYIEDSLAERDHDDNRAREVASR